MGYAFQRMKGELEQQDRDIEEFESLCRPVVEYIQKKYNPHTHIIIGWSSAVLATEELGTPYDVPD